ncbi:hypothetical protein [Frankia sp. CiP3]|uniref:hypothetical protein n=1 Tax=Frankia sp. CiP3 TaxID=2880971 RepID=UPI001EF68086|nr:hypothetical protein [Frankia sp. CiP3]
MATVCHRRNLGRAALFTAPTLAGQGKRSLCSNALAIDEATYGPDHPSVVTIRGNLESARNALGG